MTDGGGPGAGQDRGAPPPLPDPLPLPVVDNHTHVDIARDGGERPDLGEVLAAARRVGVDRIVQIGCDLEAARWTVEQAVAHPEVLGGVALHPNEVPPLASRGELAAAYAEIERLAQHPRVRVVGETGLDYFRTGSEGQGVQQESFRWHIDLAKRLGLALQIHDRDSHEDVLRILAEEGAPEVTVLHCFSGDIAMARECVERGYYLSFAGTVTFRSAKSLRDALSIVPLGQVLVETDAPYLTPHPWRGATNAPYLIPVTLRSMATTLNVDVPTLCRAVSDNAERIYGGWA
ncbi:TatD family hydrolase [Arsenicicoccus sp. oral taxon 190]|uniref:TatD family hydrolase n=1 Tax=Arsenicicoccus sp. oral taxon 190 TaxID=1658671 RepID=UPI00067A4063|nr:TatD family hydrolase [Arsenicicoccus sp. oral taxon 190]AKT50204.1 AraC family transcriptional regulator [Arsenicicoccus sp. oral taxon 190]